MRGNESDGTLTPRMRNARQDRETEGTGHVKERRDAALGKARRDRTSWGGGDRTE